MNTAQIIAAFVIAVTFVMLVIRFANRAYTDDVVKVPRHVPMGEVDHFTPQEVYNWVVYITKLTGRGYIDQMNWNPNSIHTDLLRDLYMVNMLRGEAEIDDWFNRVGDVHDLDTSIVNMPI